MTYTNYSNNWLNPIKFSEIYTKPGADINLTSTIRYLPQTCTKYLSQNLWLSGSGPYLSIYKIVDNIPKLVKEDRIFIVERIKGIKVIKDNSDNFELIVFGGKSLKFINLLIKENNFEVSSLSEELQAKDWILDIFQSGLNKFNLLLTHNIVFKLEFTSNYLVLSEELIYSPINCLLYSGKFLTNSLVAIGTIFNSVIIWNYGKASSSNENRKLYGKIECELKAHEGVIFNIHFTPSLSKLVSVSDDRSIRVWERTNGKPDEYQYELTHTIYGHTNRIWDCKFLPDDSKLASISEDSTLKYWELTNNNYLQKQSWKVCEGKNCWSLDINATGDQALVGSNDSSLKLLNLLNLKKIENENELCFNFELPNLIEYNSKIAITTRNTIDNGEEVTIKSKPKRDFIRNFAPLDIHSSLGISDLGYVFEFNLKKCENNNWTPSKPELVSHFPELEHYCMVGSLEYDELKLTSPLIVLGTLTGEVIILTKSNESDNGFIIKKLQVFDQKVVSLKLTKYKKDSYLLLTYSINNKPKLYLISNTDNQIDIEIINELELDNLHPMTITYDACLNHIAIGSRQGSLLIYEFDETLNSLKLIKNIENSHKSESLTSLRYHNSRLITGGRDGAYQILNPLDSYSIQLYSKLTKGWIEGIQIINNQILISYFFRKRLIVLNLTTNEELFSIQCGGGHREWYLLADNSNLTFGSFVYLRKEKIIIYPIGNDINYNELDLVLKTGLHGKEIRALTRILTENYDELLITGAEAGNLKLIKKQNNYLKFNLNLKAHTSVITNLKLISISSKHYLISAGGSEELKIWLLTSGYHLKQVFSNPVYSKDLEVRIMTIHWIEISNLLVVGYSDGYLRLFKLELLDDLPILNLVKSTTFLNRCVLSITSVTTADKTIIACGTTGGQIGFFNANTLLNSDESDDPFSIDIVHQSGVNCLDGELSNNNQILFVSGGEDNSIGTIKVLERDNGFSVNFTKYENAHASAIQGIKFYKPNQFATCSLDQRLNGWQIEADSNLTMEFSKITNIPDPSDLQVWKSRSNNNNIELCIVGIGLELIELN